MNLPDKLNKLQIHYYYLGKLHRLQSETINYFLWFFALCVGLFSLFFLEPISCIILLMSTLIFIMCLFNHIKIKKLLLNKLLKDNKSDKK